MKKFFLFLFIVFVLYSGYSQEEVLMNTFTRESTSLNGYWKYIIDPYENGFYNYRYQPFENQTNPGDGAFFTNAKRQGKSDLVEYDFDKMDSLYVPGDWNTQKEKLFYYEGSVWYKKSFDYEKYNSKNRLFLHFGASNYKTDVYMNGQKLGQHIGGFTPFQFEITDRVKEADNYLIIKVDNTRKKEGVPTLNTDWWNYGGITRDVKLIETSETFISDYKAHLSKDNPDVINIELQVSGKQKSDQEIHVSIPDLDITSSITSDINGNASFSIEHSNIKLWSTESPYLYDFTFSIDDDKVTDQIGLRTIETNGPDILLNGESIFLKGISIHEESPINGGRCNSQEDAQKLLGWAKSLGCNYVRLAHYPHNEHMVREADKLGILVWEEIPVYWTIDWENEETYMNAQNQISEVISRDKNRASVIIWSMANETPTSKNRNSFLKSLAEFTRKKDPTRLISAALEQSNYQDDPKTRTIDDPFSEYVDVLSFNQYIGWYDGGIEKCKRIKWHITHKKPVVISEFGAGAKFGLHGDRDDRWTEEYQAYLYEETLDMIDQIDQLRGVSPWILVDFRSPRRVLPEIQETYNRKGLISEKGEKKMAFYVLKTYYDSK